MNYYCFYLIFMCGLFGISVHAMDTSKNAKVIVSKSRSLIESLKEKSGSSKDKETQEDTAIIYPSSQESPKENLCKNTVTKDEQVEEDDEKNIIIKGICALAKRKVIKGDNKLLMHPEDFCTYIKILSENSKIKIVINRVKEKTTKKITDFGHAQKIACTLTKPKDAVIFDALNDTFYLKSVDLVTKEDATYETDMKEKCPEPKILKRINSKGAEELYSNDDLAEREEGIFDMSDDESTINDEEITINKE